MCDDDDNSGVMMSDNTDQTSDHLKMTIAA